MSNQLAIQVALDGIHCIVLKDGVKSNKSELRFDTSVEDKIKALLAQEFESNSMYQSDFDDISLSWASEKTTLVPNAVFSESSPQAIFELCYGKNDADVDYNRISELSVVNVYEIPDWIKRFFVIKFPRINIQHEGSLLVRQVLHENAFKLKSTIVFYQNHFQLIISKHNELIFYSNFSYQSAEDIIYHVMFVLQQKELIADTGSFELIQGLGASDETVEAVKNGLERIQDLKKFNVVISDNFIQKAHLLCV